jgi:hypothetical protein
MASLDVASPRRGDELGQGFDATWAATFTRAPYSPSATRNHCVFCWATFVEPGDRRSDARDEGYVTTAPFSAVGDDCLWVCDPCFHEHKEEFAWQVAHASIQ